MQVFLKNEIDKTETSQATNASGVALFENLRPGENYIAYTLDNEDYQFASSTPLKPQAGQTISFRLYAPSRVTAVLGEVLISSSPLAKMNTQNATVSGQIKKEELMKMPIEGRDITRSLYRLPNVTIAVLGYAEGPNVSINGLNGIFTNYLIDGMDNNERFLGNMKLNTPVGFVENVTVLTNNYSAEWGNTSNGIVNVLSRSGTNEVTGEVFFLTRPGAVVDAPSDFATLDLSGNQVKDGFQRYQGGWSIGAPLQKDKTFLYWNVEHTTDIKDNLLNVPDLNVNETVRGYNRFTYHSLKVDHLWNKKIRSSLRTQLGEIYIDRQGGGLEGGNNFPSSASAQQNDTYLIALRNQMSINNRWATELNFQTSYFRWNFRQPVNPTSPSVTVRNPAGQNIAVLGQSGAIFDDKEYTQQFQNKWFYNEGAHHVKAGVEFISSDFALLGGGNPFGQYTVRLDSTQLADLQNQNLGSTLDVEDIPSDVEVLLYEVELQTKSFGKTQNVTSLYIEDTYAVSDRLNVNAGLRWDYDNLSKSGGDQGDWNNIAPRLSANYKLNERSVIRGGYGIFYDKIKYSVYSDALQFSTTSGDFFKQLEELQRLGLLDADADLNQITFNLQRLGLLDADVDLNQITFNGNQRANLPGVTYLNGPSGAELSDARENIFTNNARILNPNGWDNPYSHQFTLGYQYKPDNETIFIFDAVHTRTEGLYIIRNLNVASPYLFEPGVDAADVVARTRAEGDLSRPIPVYNAGGRFFNVINGDTLRGGARNIFMTETAGRANYTALNFMLQRELADGKLGYRLLYTLSWTKSNTSSINTRAQDNNDFDAEFVWDENDRRHVMSAVVLYQPLKGLSIAPTALLQSGQPVTRVADATVFGTTDLNGDGESFGLTADRWPGEEEAAGRLPWSATFDLSIKYLLRLNNSKNGFEFSVDVFNIFDAQNWSGFSSTRGTSNQVQVGPPDSNNYRIINASPPRQFQFGTRFIF